MSPPHNEPFDAIVVGSGMTGGWAAKELTEHGLRTLVIERGRHVEHGKDYITEWLQPWDFPHRGRHMTVTRVANLTHDHGGRTRCQARNQCARGCSFGAYFSSLSSTLPAARKSGRLTIVTDAIVESVLYDEAKNRATGVRVIDA